MIPQNQLNRENFYNMNKDFKKLLKIALPVFLFVIILSYTYYRTKNLVGGVILEIAGVTDGQTFDESPLTLTGSARNASKLTIDGREIFIDKDANFAEQLLLLPGYNILEIKAEDKFGKKVEKHYQLVLK